LAFFELFLDLILSVNRSEDR